MTVLAFDVYGTLIDTAGVTGRLAELVGDRAAVISAQWRAKQLEYTWRYGLMGKYRDFRVCTRQALDWTCAQNDCGISETDKDGLMALYLELPPFEDVPDGLKALKSLGISMYAFSNGLPSDLETLLGNAGLLHLMDGIVSVDDKKSFKPNPMLYQYMVERGGSDTAGTWLVSSNGFDVCGAVAAGLNAFWVQRDPAITFDPWEFRPTRIVHGLGGIVECLENR